MKKNELKSGGRIWNLRKRIGNCTENELVTGRNKYEEFKIERIDYFESMKLFL